MEEVNELEQRPRWVSVEEEGYPKEDGYYFVKGKRCGFYISFDKETNKFDFPFNVAHNHIAERYLMWLDEN